MSRNYLLIGLLAVAGSLFSTQARAQSQTGAIQGVVSDSSTGETLAGVTVVVTSPALQGTQSAITGGNGYYKISNLPSGNYVVTFYYSDITVRKSDQVVTVNKSTPVYIKIDTTHAGGEVINVEGRAPTVDPTSTNQGITLDQNYTKNIPVPGRTFESALGAAAGTQNDGVGVSFSGSSSLENQYVVDGVNTTGLTFGTVGSGVITDFIEEIEVITGGYQAEYGRSTGGVVNVVTKQGSNEFHGTVFSYFSNSFLAADLDASFTQSSAIGAQSNVAYDLNFGFDLGGPIIKDKLWFYVGFAPRLIAVDVDKITRRRTDCRTILPNGELSNCDPEMYGDGQFDEDLNGLLIFDELDRTKRRSQGYEYQFVSKLNYALAPEHQGQLTFSGQPYQEESLGVAGDPRSISTDVSILNTDLAAKWTSKFNDNKTELEAVLGWHRLHAQADSIDESANDIPHQTLLFGNLGTWSMLGFESDATRRGCTDSTDPAADPYPFIENCPDAGVGYSIGGIGGMTDHLEQRYQGRLSATQRIPGAAGNHEIKAGLDVEDNSTNPKRLISGDVFFTNYLGNSVQGPFNRVEAFRYVALAPPNGDPGAFPNLCVNEDDEMVACDFTPDPNVEGNTFNWASYLQDSWQVLPNLTVNAGIRYEEQRLRYAKDLQNTTDPFTGNELGTNAMLLRNMWAPRAGVLYDWTKEGRSKVYTSWGRYYESIPMRINERTFGGETSYVEDFDSAAQCGANSPGIGGPDANNCSGAPQDPLLFGSGVLITPGIKPQFLDEYIVGAEYEVMEDFKLGINYNNRRLGRVIEDVSVDNAATYILANPGEFSEDEERKLIAEINALDEDDPERTRLEGQLEQFQGVRIFDTPRRDYNAVNVMATKRFSKQFYMQGSYTYQRTEGNYQGLFTSDNGQVDPNINSQYDLIELLANRDGPLPQDRPHYFKLDGYYVFDLEAAGNVTTGARFRALSGTPVGATGRHHRYGPDESFLLPRGSMGRTAASYDLDLRIGYGRDLGKGMKLQLFASLFSIFNNQTQASVDGTYTFDPVNPVVGGEFEDLVFAKAQTLQGNETSNPVGRNRNYRQTSGRYSPFSAQLGARLEF